jgi:hypothetical protein
MMNLRKLVDRSFVPAIIISLLMIVLTIIAYYAGFKKTDESFIKSFLYFFDLNEKFNGAMWISVALWIITGLSFSMLGLSKTSSITLSKVNKLFLIVLGFFMCFLSFEKIFEFHLMIEFRAINFLGLFSEDLRKDSPYFWLYYILAPAFLLVVINLFLVYFKLFHDMSSNKKLQKIARNLFILALLSVPLTIIFDIIQGYLWYSGQKNTVFNSIESCWEVVGLTCFIGSNKYIAKFYTV